MRSRERKRPHRRHRPRGSLTGTSSRAARDAAARWRRASCYRSGAVGSERLAANVAMASTALLLDASCSSQGVATASLKEGKNAASRFDDPNSRPQRASHRDDSPRAPSQMRNLIRMTSTEFARM
jgi:hypothetical protein